MSRASFRDASLQHLHDALNDNPHKVVAALFGSRGMLVDNGSAYLIGNVAGCEGSSLRVELAGPKKGTWKDFASSDHSGDMLNLIQYHHGYAKKGYLYRRAREILGMPEPEWQPAGAAVTTSTEDKRAKAAALWKAGKPLHATAASIYLEARSIDHTALKNLRYVAGAWYRYEAVDGDGVITAVKGTAPALLAKVVNLRGRLIGVHRIYLNADGGRAVMIDTTGKNKHKRTLGPLIGGACRLQGDDPRCIIAAEAIEDGAAIATALPKATVWACPTGPHLAQMEVPAETRYLIVASDNDAEGEQYYQRIRSRFSGRKDLAIFRARSRRKDWNEDLQYLGSEQVAAAIRAVYRDRVE